MIVTRQGSELRLITQSDHARLASQILALWRLDGLPDHPRREELLFAVREHDNGWRETDAAPSRDPADGRPLDFRSCPQALRRQIWDRGIRRFAAERPYASALIIHHALALHRTAAGEDPDWHDLLAQLEERQDDLLRESECSPTNLDHDYGLLALGDLLSLALCSGSSQPLEGLGCGARLDADSLYIEPFPLAGATRFEIPCRWIPDRSYGSDSDLGRQLASSRWRAESVRLVPDRAAAGGDHGSGRLPNP